MKLAIVNQHHDGGATTAAREALSFGPAFGLDVTYFPRDAEHPESREDLLRELEALAPDVVHVHCWYQTWDYDLLIDLCARFKVVFTAHDPFVVNQYGAECWECFRNPWCLGCPELGPIRRYRPNYRILERLAKRRVNRRAPCHVVCPSQWMERRLSRSEWGSRPTTVIPNGVDTERFSPGDSRRPGVGLPDDGVIALFVGNMYGQSDHRKGLPDLLAAWSAVRGLAPDALLAVAGRMVDVELPAGVIALGEVDGERVRELYRCADVFVLPTHGDNLPVTVQEAMACGLPVVGTRVGGLPEQIEEFETGLLVSPGDRVALADALATVLTDGGLRERMGAAARRRCLERYSRDVSARLHVELYRRLSSD